MTDTARGEHGALRVIRNPFVVLLALAGGAALGRWAPAASLALEPLGRVYLLLLQMTLVPILVLATTGGVAKLAQHVHAPRILLRTLAVLAAFAVFAACLAIAAGIVGHPGRGLATDRTAYLVQVIRGAAPEADLAVSLRAARAAREQGTLVDLVSDAIPRNIFESLSSGSVVEILVFALLLGVAVGLLRPKSRDVMVDVVEKALDGFKRVNLWLIYALPLGAVLLVSHQVAVADVAMLSAIGRLLATTAACLAAGTLLLAIATWARCGARPISVVSSLVEPLTYALITGERLAAAPYAIRAAHERLGCDRETADAAIPFTMVVARLGYFVYYILAGIFIADFYGVSLFSTEYLVLALGAAVAAMATQGSAAAGTLAVMSLALGPLGLPAEPIVTVFASATLVVGPLAAVFETQASIAAAALIARRAEAPARGRARVRMISLRTSILALLASLVVLTGVVTVGLMASGQVKNISYLADTTIGEISARVVQRTEDYFSPAERSVAGFRYLLEQRVLDPADTDAMIAIMRRQVTDNPEFAAVYFGGPDGRFTMVKRMPDGSLSNRIITRTADAVHVRWEHANPAYEAPFPSGAQDLATGYDPRTRGWYRDAVTTGGQIWTNVYLFASDNMLGISNAVPIRRGDALVGVLAVDIGLAELSYFLGSLDVAEAGRAYLLDAKNELVALSMPRGSELSALFSGQPTGSVISSANLVLADEAADELVRRSFLAWLRTADRETTFSFAAGDARYLSRILAFPPDALFDWKIGLVVPEARLYGYVDRTTRIVLAAAALIIVMAIGIGVTFSRVITQPLRRLSREMERVRDFDLGAHEAIVSRIAEVHRMTDAFENMKHGLSAFKKYVPSRLVAELIRLGEEPRIGGRRRELTLLFTDVADFSAVSEELSPEDLVEEMAVYFGALSNVIMEHRGTVDKYIGDAVMAFWNAPAPVENHAELACRSALACQQALRRLAPSGAAAAGPSRSVFRAGTRIGIHTGEVIVGNMGSPERLNYTAIGDSVNLASRLEGMNKNYRTSIIISETTRAAAGGAVVARLLDKVAVKGRKGGIRIYELLDPEARPDAAAFADLATQAVERYLARAFDEALSLMKRAGRIHPEDPALSVIRRRCEDFRANPPPPEWDGVHVYHEK